METGEEGYEQKENADNQLHCGSNHLCRTFGIDGIYISAERE